MKLPINRIVCSDVLDYLRSLPDGCVNTCVTSPPYWGLRDYGVDGQLGLEATPDEYVTKMVDVFAEVRRVLRKDGTLWLNLGDSYATGGMSNPSSKSTLGGGKDRGASSYLISRNIPDGLKHKDLVGIPWRVAFALQSDGWYLRSDIIWHKPNPMPESVTDRCTKAHEYIFLLSKSAKYYYDNEAIKEEAVDEESYKGRRFRGPKSIYLNNAIPSSMNHQSFDKGKNELAGKTYEKVNKRSVWTVTVKPFNESHFATFPPNLIEPCIKAGCPEGGIVLDPFMGAGTTALVATGLGRNWLGCELNPEYVAIAERRLNNEVGILLEAAR